MKYRKGERVRHPTREDWGLGEVLADSGADTVRVFFVGAGEKTIGLKYVQLPKVSGNESAHPVLDNLKVSGSGPSIKYQSLPQSIQFFLEQYPDGFYGPRFVAEEREYKERAHTLGLELLGQESFLSLLENSEYQEIAKHALHVVNATNW